MSAICRLALKMVDLRAMQRGKCGLEGFQPARIVTEAALGHCGSGRNSGEMAFTARGCLLLIDQVSGRAVGGLSVYGNESEWASRANSVAILLGRG